MNKPLGPVYNKRQHQCCNNSVMTLATLLSFKTMELLQNGIATLLGVTPLFSIRPVLLALSQHCRNVDADAQCKRALHSTKFYTDYEWVVE